jgi:hypothetical protein
MKNKTVTVYSINDLTGAAKERALDSLRQGVFDASIWYNSVLDDAVTVAALFGLDLESR